MPNKSEALRPPARSLCISSPAALECDYGNATEMLMSSKKTCSDKDGEAKPIRPLCDVCTLGPELPLGHPGSLFVESMPKGGLRSPQFRCRRICCL